MLNSLSRLLLLCRMLCGAVIVLRGKVSDKYRTSSVVASTSEECWKACGAKDCSVSYSSGNCSVYLVTAQLLLWDRAQRRLFAHNAEGWQTLVAELEEEFEAPLILWPLDGAVRGSNLGSAGQQLDLRRTHGLLYDEEGPRPASPLRYARRQGAMYEQNRVSIVQNGDLLFTPTRPFTFATWFRVEQPTESFDLLTGNPLHSFVLRFEYASQYCQRGMAEPCYNSKELQYFNLATSKMTVLYSNLFISTYWYPAPQKGWIHFAFVSHGEKKFRFYINGKPWPGYTFNQPVFLKTPTALSLWSGSRTTYKSLAQACMTVFQAALEESAVLNLIQACP